MDKVFLLLNQIAITAMKRSEIVGAVFVVSVVFMMIMPLPTGLVDVLIALNISLSSLLIVTAMYLPGPLAFSTFPSMLLFTTMFRLALSISTTRLILLEQDAGDIVEAFGTFAVGGNLAVGLVIFLILTIVNFLVITKGSERVAEVGARFSLDAMPGKQMSIDSDLRAGLITSDEAVERRNRLAKESQLFGAMDGAMKFVKGDAIASLVIVAINLIGGFSVGIAQHEMTAGESMQLYSVLTIGDGLISQIPALLISLTAGIIITRVSADKDEIDANIGREIAEQLTSQPKAWIIAAFGMIGFSLLPGMPTAIFLIFAALSMLSGGFQLLKEKRAKAAASAHNDDQLPPELNGHEDLRLFIPARPLLLQFPASMADSSALIEEVVTGARRSRNSIVSQYGITLPSLEVDFSTDLAQDEFRFCVYEVPSIIATLASNKVAIDINLLEETQINEGKVGTAAREEDRFVWFDAQHALANNEALNPTTSLEIILTRLERIFFSAGPQFIGLQETKSILGWIESEQPELAQELQRVVPTSRFSSILQRLAHERIPLRAIRPISEALIEHGQYERDVGALVDYVRINLKAHICHQYAQEDGMHVWLLTPETEELLRDSLRQTQTESFFALSQDASQNLIDQLREAFPILNSSKPVLLVAQDIRRVLRSLLQDEFDHIPVLSFSELMNTSQVNVMGRIALEG